MHRRVGRVLLPLLISLPAVFTPHIHAQTGAADRAETVAILQRIADPVLTAAAAGQLHQRMPVEGPKGRDQFSHLEALGRLLDGMAPWLELGPDSTPEGQLRARYIALARKAIHHAVDPTDPDHLNFTEGGQRLVDAAFLAQALLRAPHQLWDGLSPADHTNLVTALKATRSVKPPESNWVLFTATIEAALWQFTGDANVPAIQSAIDKHMLWYKGDGLYGDGNTFHWDYYNSFVIQPMLLSVAAVCRARNNPCAADADLILTRAQRYAEIEEELISPEATFPVIGRSTAYRMGAMQLLSDVALLHKLPPALDPGAVRSALTAVTRRIMSAPGTFDQDGWLTIGTVGHQPARGETYISTGSLYLCALGLLHLGLPPEDPFWTAPAAPWTQKRIWSGENIPADHAISK